MASGPAEQRDASPVKRTKGERLMSLLGKAAIVIGMAGAMALGSISASQARFRAGPAVAAGVAGFALGAAAANANSGYYPYGGDGYDSYAYQPGYGTQSYYGAPYSHSEYGYNSNAVSPMRERQLEGRDY
jgi:hypothetical protein